MMINEQIKLLKKYGVKNYTVENGKITINGYLYLNSLIEFPWDLFTDTTIKSKYLHLNAKMATETIVDNIYKNSPNANIIFYC